MNLDFMMMSVLNNKINNFSSEDYFTNFLLFIFFLFMIFKDYDMNINFSVSSFLPQPNKLRFESEQKDFITFEGSYRPILDYISENHSKDVKCFRQENLLKSCEDDHSRDTSYFVPGNRSKILIDKERKIYAYMYSYRKEKYKFREERSYKTINGLELYSYYSSMETLIDLEKQIVSKWKNQMEKKYKDNTYIFSLWWENNLHVRENLWSSSATFENSYFPNKKEIIQKIDYFLNNKEDYLKKGNPYTLGILLYGLPGGGKTRFIKQLLNYTKRHAVEIDLSNNFDFKVLKNILNSQDIGNGIKIPTNDKIFIFEDIDAATKKLKSREKEDDVVVIKKESEKIKAVTEEKNTLSTFLNILDGVSEASGRICIFTTNHIDRIDPAVFRPGRIDIKIKVKKLNIEQVYEMCVAYWKEEFKYSLDDLHCSVNDKYTSAMINGLFKSVSHFEQIKDLFIF